MGNSPERDKVVNVIRSAISHLQRAKEGSRLLKEGKSLSEMRSPIEGPTEEYLLLKRQEFVNGLQNMKKDSLQELLKETDEHILRLSQKKLAGNSELLWQRIVILAKLGKI